MLLFLFSTKRDDSSHQKQKEKKEVEASSEEQLQVYSYSRTLLNLLGYYIFLLRFSFGHF